jgi:hydroxymethylglutaryl-CoA lyase
LKAGFDTVEVGSFVSEKAIPQMRDTAEVLRGLKKQGGKTRVMVLVGNRKRAGQAGEFEVIDDLLFPFSISETFLKKNINSDFERSKDTIKSLLELSARLDKRLIVYLTMAFGNPYGDQWSVQAVVDWAGYLQELGLKIIPLSDILGDVTPERITQVYTSLIKTFPGIEFGIHLHARPDEWYSKVDAAWKAGVRRFDSVTGGIGGCPMADDELVGNLNTLDLIKYCEKNEIYHGLDAELLKNIGF